MKAILGFLRAMFDFLRTMMTFPKPWVVWIMLLMMVNMVIPLFYLGTLEGKVVLGGFVLGALFQGGIFSANGFVRLLGIGHLPWEVSGTPMSRLRPDTKMGRSDQRPACEQLSREG